MWKYCRCICGCLVLSLLLSGCVRLSAIKSDTPPSERYFFGLREHIRDAHLYVNPWIPILNPIGIACWFARVPIEFVGDVFWLPYDVYVNLTSAVHPNVNYCVRFNKIDKLRKMLEDGASPNEGGSGPYYSDLTPEATARKYDSLGALAVLMEYDLKMTPELISYVCDQAAYPETYKLNRKNQSNLSLEDIKEREHLLRTAAAHKKEYFLKDEKGRNIPSEWLRTYCRLISRERSWNHRPKESFELEEKAVKLLPPMMDYLFSQGFSTDIPLVRHTCYYYNPGHSVSGDMRGTLLDFVENSDNLPYDLKLNLLDVLHAHGALRYRELVKEHPELPHLDIEGVHIPQRLMWIVDILRNSPKADCYRLRNGGVIGLSENDLVLEAGIKDPESGKLIFEKIIELPRKKEDGTRDESPLVVKNKKIDCVQPVRVRKKEDGTKDESVTMAQVSIPLVYRMIFRVPSPEVVHKRKHSDYRMEQHLFLKEQFVFPKNDDKFVYHEKMTMLGIRYCDVYYQFSSLGGTKDEREAFFNDSRFLDRMFRIKFESLPRHQKPYSGVSVFEPKLY